MEMNLRPLEDKDRYELAELIYSSFNSWYPSHGMSQIFQGGPQVTEIYYEVYNEISPGCSIAAFNPANDRLMGACFYHPREHHVSLGIMAVHPNYFGCGVGGQLLKHIIDFTDNEGFESLRLTQSAISIDSFSLYSKAGCQPRYAYQDMLLKVPENGIPNDSELTKTEMIRKATLQDVELMAELEMEVSGISRISDYRYLIENRLKMWNVHVIENPENKLDGYMVSSDHPACNILGPCVTKTEQDAASLLHHEINLFKGRMPLFIIPVEKDWLVRKAYSWGARNCELHFCQVRGKFQSFNGVNMPSFLPETG